MYPMLNMCTGWHKESRAGGGVSQRSGPRLIVFIVGGVTYSEMRSAHEVIKQNGTWDVHVGGSHILTPERFLKDLRELSLSPGAVAGNGAPAPTAVVAGGGIQNA